MSHDTARLALYIRAATIDRANDREQLLRTHAAAQSIGSVCAVYADLNGSRRRHDLNAALTDAQAGRFDVLLVQSMNELTGAPRLQQIVERFQAAAVTVRSLAEQFDSTSPLAAFWMLFADADSAVHQQRSRRGIEQAARRGPSRSRPRRRGSAGPVVAVQALYDAVGGGQLPWLDELLIAAGAVRRRDCSATAPAGQPCPLCGIRPAAIDHAHTNHQKGQ